MPAPAEPGVLPTERHSLTLSLVATFAVGGLGLTWGIISGSRVMVFDGIYTLAGIVLTWVSMLAARAAASAPSTEFPFGRNAAIPLAVTVQGAALLGTAGYGAVDAVISISEGGSATSALQVMLYGLVCAAASLVVMLLLRGPARRSDLARAELVSWRAGVLLSALFALGGGIAVLMASNGMTAVAGYVDPVLVIVASAVVIPMSLGLVRDGVRELLEAAPTAALSAAIDEAVRAGTAAGLPADRTLPPPIVRATKLGRRVYVEVDFVVQQDSWTVSEEDDVRRSITAHLDGLGYRVWANVEITTDAHLAAD
ncbi:cation transporter [Isoptericola dokdonensis]|jgi:predicted Co/Zn/Cd cation transporter (cation efflux family)|uniref:Cation efflux family protein n=1 Tax=Isoptericola dokdonensis DS-3 TaxID=1300344 RepID=A0A161I7Q5_9MICO|nr:cation transporter [Isoptericola dokdonensis]ANC31658.1 Cation efflux family protein [Isoptericola dokdonensis DS-3]